MATILGKVVKGMFQSANGKTMMRVRDDLGKFYTLQGKKGVEVDFSQAKIGTDVVVTGTPVAQPTIYRDPQTGVYNLAEGYTREYENNILVIRDGNGNVVAKVGVYEILYVHDLTA